MVQSTIAADTLANSIVSLALHASWHTANTRSVFFFWDAARPREAFEECSNKIIPALPRDLGEHITGVIWRAAWHAANYRARLFDDAEEDRHAFHAHAAKLAEIIPSELANHIQWLAWRAAWYAANARCLMHFHDAAVDRSAFSEYAATLCRSVHEHGHFLSSIRSVETGAPDHAATCCDETHESYQAVAESKSVFDRLAAPKPPLSPETYVLPRPPSAPSVWPRTKFRLGSPPPSPSRERTATPLECYEGHGNNEAAAVFDGDDASSESGMRSERVNNDDVKWLFHDAAWYAANDQLARAVETSRWFPLKAQYVRTLRGHASQDKARFEALSRNVVELLEPISPGLGKTLAFFAWDVAHDVTARHAIENGVVVSMEYDYEAAWRKHATDLQAVHGLSADLAEHIKDMAWEAAMSAAKQRSSWTAEGAKEPERRFHEHADVVASLLQKLFPRDGLHESL